MRREVLSGGSGGGQGGEKVGGNLGYHDEGEDFDVGVGKAEGVVGYRGLYTCSPDRCLSAMLSFCHVTSVAAFWNITVTLSS